MTKAEAIKNIMNRINEIKENAEFEYIGVRVQENRFKEGEILDNSFVWVNGEMTDEELPGTCAVKLEDAQLANSYFGEHVAIIGSNTMEYGQDLGEIILKDAEVMEVLA